MDYYYESVVVRFQRILKMFEENGDSKAVIKHKEELFGTSQEYVYPDIYSMVGLGKDLLGAYPDFFMMLKDPTKVRLAAQMIAQKRLENIVEILIRHEGIVKRNKDKLESKASKPPASRKSKPRRRR